MSNVSIKICHILIFNPKHSIIFLLLIKRQPFVCLNYIVHNRIMLWTYSLWLECSCYHFCRQGLWAISSIPINMQTTTISTPPVWPSLINSAKKFVPLVSSENRLLFIIQFSTCNIINSILVYAKKRGWVLRNRNDCIFSRGQCSVDMWWI